MKSVHVTLAITLGILTSSAVWTAPAVNAQPASRPHRQAAEAESPSTYDHGVEWMHELSASCPMLVDGVELVVSDTDGGVALSFMTNTPDIADLRVRVRAMAELYETHQGQGPMMWQQMGGHGRGRGMGIGLGMENMEGNDPMPVVTTTVTDTENGARIELRPVDPSQLGALREHIGQHQQRMGSGECWRVAARSGAQDGQ